jgi:hypothetical protein
MNKLLEGRRLGMSKIFDENGKLIPRTHIADKHIMKDTDTQNYNDCMEEFDPNEVPSIMRRKK